MKIITKSNKVLVRLTKQQVLRLKERLCKNVLVFTHSELLSQGNGWYQVAPLHEDSMAAIQTKWTLKTIEIWLDDKYQDMLESSKQGVLNRLEILNAMPKTRRVVLVRPTNLSWKPKIINRRRVAYLNKDYEITQEIQRLLSFQTRLEDLQQKFKAA